MLLKAIAESTEQTQQVTPTDTTDQTTENTTGTDDFSTLLTALLSPDQGNNVSEEALFAAMTVERVKALKGEEAGKKFEELLKQTETSMTKADGYVPYEDAARVALKSFRDSGELTLEEADQVHSEAFGAAQLDSNLTALYDDRGGTSDLTKAVMTMTEALTSAKAVIAKYTSGEEKVTTRTLDSGFSAAGAPLVNPYDTGSGVLASLDGPISAVNNPTGTTMDGSEGFLYKPISNNSGKLAVLMPSSISTQVLSVALKDSLGSTIEEGSFWAPGFGAEGEVNPRKKFSFTKEGDEYPDNLIVEATMADGSKVQWNIPDSSKRYD